MDTWLSDVNQIYRESPWLLAPNLDWSPLTVSLVADPFKKGSFVYHQNQIRECVYIIKSGRVNLSIVNSDGKVRSLFICGEGSLFGEIPAFISPENCSQAQVVNDSLIYRVAKNRFDILFNSNKTIARNTAIILAKKVRIMTAQIESLMFPDAARRVANILLYLAEQYGTPCDSGIQLTMNFSHQEVANLIGTSRVTVTNAFRQLEEDGVVRKTRGRLHILNKERLLEMLAW